MIDVIQVVTTTSTKEEADTIAGALVSRKLAACVQVLGPLSSTYYWKDSLETSQEWLCIIKTTQSHYAAIEKAIRELHSYEVPELLAFPVTGGSSGYLDWLRRAVEDLPGPGQVSP